MMMTRRPRRLWSTPWLCGFGAFRSHDGVPPVIILIFELGIFHEIHHPLGGTPPFIMTYIILYRNSMTFIIFNGCACCVDVDSSCQLFVRRVKKCDKTKQYVLWFQVCRWPFKSAWLSGLMPDSVMTDVCCCPNSSKFMRSDLLGFNPQVCLKHPMSIHSIHFF